MSQLKTSHRQKRSNQRDTYIEMDSESQNGEHSLSSYDANRSDRGTLFQDRDQDKTQLSDLDRLEKEFREGPQENRLQRWYKYLHTYSAWSRFVITVLPLNLVFVTFALLDLFIWNGERKVLGVTIGRWSIYGASLWTLFFVSRIAIQILPNLIGAILGVVTISTQRYMDYIRHSQTYAALVIFSSVSWGIFTPLTYYYDDEKGVVSQFSIEGLPDRVFLFALLSSIILTMEKIIVQVIAIHFHQTTYQERILTNKYAISILHQLYSQARRLSKNDSFDTEFFLSPRKLDSKAMLNKFLKQTKNAIDRTTSTLGTIASEISGTDPNKDRINYYLQSSEEARNLGKILFNTLSSLKKDRVCLDDFIPILGLERAERALGIFDKDNNGDLSKEELVSSVVDIYKEKKAISNSLRDLDNIVGKLDSIFTVGCLILIILIGISTFQDGFSAYIAATGSALLALSFMLGSTAQAFFESMVLIFVRHPFDVGDRLEIEQKIYNCTEIGLLSSTFVDGNGKIHFIPNQNLASKNIINIRRSKNIFEKFRLTVTLTTTMDQLDHFKSFMLKFLRNNERDFLTDYFDLTVEEISDHRLAIEITIPYRGNWQDMDQKSYRKNMFMIALIEAIEKAQIQCVEPIETIAIQATNP